MLSRLILVALALVLGSCATPTSKLRALANEAGFERASVRASGYVLTVFSNAAPVTDGVLHVYLEGDGTPWRHRTVIMPDPTPRRPLMLGLMGLDPTAAIYVGRPCYNGTYNESGCDNRMWTSDRYSTRVVDSMAAVIRGRAALVGARSVRLFGHSGGGTLALLIAERLERVDAVVTVAGNLDTEAWTTHHGYSPLRGSMNPARRVPLPGRVRQWHLLGGDDAVIPPTLVGRYLASVPNAVAVRLEGYGHGCCWGNAWPRVLRALADDEPAELPGERVLPALPQAGGEAGPDPAPSAARNAAG